MAGRCVPALVLLYLVSSVACSAKDLGVFGAVYDIAEKDALKEIEEKARQADVNRIVNRGDLAKKLRNYAPEDLREMKLRPAREEKTFLVDMTYALDRDIGDEKGNVIYPRGYMFNPLDYITYPGTLVIVDGGSPTQVDWFKHSVFSRDVNAKLLITGGSYAELSKTLKRPVFYANRIIIEVFRIKAVPSVVKQKGAMMEVREFPVTEKKGRYEVSPSHQ